jgi:L-2-hydroxyglutarate oxidase
LATAYRLSREFPADELRITLVEKEEHVAEHQTGRNSGVLHSGVYYRPGSTKALTCRTGKKAMEAFCTREEIPFEICGKVIVAIEPRDLPALEEIYRRGQENGVTCRMIEREELAEIEPYTAGIRAIHVAESGIVDYRVVAEHLARRIEEAGHEVILGTPVVDIQERADGVLVRAAADEWHSDYLVNCGGLHSDRLARTAGMSPEAQIVPFRGEYFELRPEARRLCRGLIYPTPDPRFPFLGVHFTKMIDGGVECGPNAVLAFAREGYTLGTVNPRDLLETLRFSGFRHLAGSYWRTGLGEMWRSASKKAFVKALQRLVPEVQEDDLVAAPAGVRAQAVRPDGAMVDDFAFDESVRMVHVLNAPSPAATASLEIGRHIANRLKTHLE